MCLTTITRTYKKRIAINKPVIRFKVFTVKKGKLESSHRSIDKIRNIAEVILGEWYKADDTWQGGPYMVTTEDDYNKKYLVGFHSYKTLEDAEKALDVHVIYITNERKYAICKVEVKEIHTSGIQDGSKVDVSKYLKVIEVVKDYDKRSDYYKSREGGVS